MGQQLRIWGGDSGLFNGGKQWPGLDGFTDTGCGLLIECGDLFVLVEASIWRVKRAPRDVKSRENRGLQRLGTVTMLTLTRPTRLP